MRISKDALNTKYMLQHLDNYPEESMVFVSSPEDECEITPVTEIKQVNLKEDGCSLGTGKLNAFLLVTGDTKVLTVKKLKEIIEKIPKTAITVMQVPGEEFVSVIVSSQPTQVEKNESGFNLINSGDYNGVFFDFNED